MQFHEERVCNLAQQRKKTHMEEQESIIECLQEQLIEEKRANKCLHWENRGLHKECLSLKTEILVLKKRIEACRYNFTEATFERFEQISRNRHLATKYEAAEEKVSQVSSQLDQLYTDSLALREENRELKKVLEKIQGKPARTGNVSSVKNAPNSDDSIISLKSKEQLRGSQENAKSLNEESIAEQDHRFLFSELEDMDGASNKIPCQEKKLRLQELKEQEKTFKEQLEVAKKTIVEKNTNILDLRRKMEDNADNLAKHQDLNDELKSKESVLVEKVKSLSSENAYLNSQIQGAQNALHEKDELIATHEHKSTESGTYVEELNEKLKHFKQTIEQQQQQLDGMPEDQIFRSVEDETPTSSGEKVNLASDLLDEINKLHTEQDVLRNANTSLSTEVVELRAENVNLLSQNAHEIDKVKELNAAVDSLKDEIGNLLLSFREKDCIIDDQDNEICSLKRKIQEYSSELDNSKKDEADSESESIFSYLYRVCRRACSLCRHWVHGKVHDARTWMRKYIF